MAWPSPISLLQRLFMSGISCLYRRPSGIYVVRLVVPVRLRPLVGRGEIHVSTGLRDGNAAKLAALKIQMHWRERFMALDVEKLVTASPLLHGGGLISVCEAARTIGLSDRSLLGELLNDRARIYTQAQGWFGCRVPNLDDIERDYDSTFIWGSVQAKGEESVYSGSVRFIDNISALSVLIDSGVVKESSFALDDGGGFFLDDVREISLSGCMVQKSAVESCRARLSIVAKPEPTPVMALANHVSEGIVIVDVVTAKHGKKQFSELFDLYRKHKKWGEDQQRRMATEAGLFIELMNDPSLGSIEVDTIHEYANRLSRLPSDIYQSRRRYKVDSLNELMSIAERDSLPRKNETTVKGHVGRIAEILNYGVRPAGMLRVNPASGFQRDWGISKKARAQDDRDEFTTDELGLIFSQEWFLNGAGSISQTGVTNWRPHYFWMPLLALITGGRLNELAQLHLDDIVRAEKDASAWYLDFNLNEPDKIDTDGSSSDKSLKTVNSIRVVPLHDVVIKAGLPEYVAALRKDGHTHLFPELKRDAVKGYGKPVGSWFNERFLGKELNIERNGKKTFHSLRHNFATAIERLDLTERVMAQLMGHERGKTQSMSRYAKDRNAIEMKSVMDRLAFPILDNIGNFKVTAAMKAIKFAQRQKRKVPPSNPGV